MPVTTPKHQHNTKHTCSPSSQTPRLLNGRQPLSSGGPADPLITAEVSGTYAECRWGPALAARGTEQDPMVGWGAWPVGRDGSNGPLGLCYELGTSLGGVGQLVKRDLLLPLLFGLASK